MSGHTTNPIVQVGDGANAASLNKHGGHNAVEVDSATLLAAINELTAEVRLFRELIASQL